MTGEKSDKKTLDRFAKDVLYGALVSVTSDVLKWTVPLLGGLLVALVVAGWRVPAWTLVAMALVSVVLVYLARRVGAREARELQPKFEKAEDELDRHDSYGKTICSALDTFQKIVAKDIKMGMGSFIEQGILNPGRDVMLANGRPSDLRMSVLIAIDDHFQMIWASGHGIEAKQKYGVPIKETISKVAYDKKAIQVWGNAPEEERSFVKNPKATREFRSMVSIPILLGGDSAGVFNILTEEEAAFDPADVNYLTSLGSIIQLAFGMAIKERRAASAEQAQAQRQEAMRRALGGRGRIKRSTPSGPLPRGAPDGRVGSSETREGTEDSDER